jgi:hypothetical protein
MQPTSASPIAYYPRPDASPETEHLSLSAIYRFVLDCHAKKKGGPATAPDSPKGGSENDSRAKSSIPLPPN